MIEHGKDEYTTYYNGEYTQVYPLEKAVRAILCRNERNEDHIKRLQEENKKLKEERWKDDELQKMKAKLDQMTTDYYRGFPISENEWAAIKEWKEKHEAEVHGITTDEQRLRAAGSIGGRYSYHFAPTSIGVSGIVRCGCGAEFEFQEIR